MNGTKHTKAHLGRRSLAVLALLLLWGAGAGAREAADRVTVALTDPSRPPIVRAHLMNGGITVRGADVKNVTVEAEPGDRDRDDDEDDDDDDADDKATRRKGLHRIAMSSAGLTAEEQNNEVNISADSMMSETNLTITVPKRSSLVLKTVNGGEISVSDVEGEIDAENVNGAIKLTSVGGSVVASTMNGELRAVLTRVDASKPMAFSSMNGDVDVTFPAGLKANLSFRTDNGEVYSDFDVKTDATGRPPVVEDSRGKGGRFRVRVDRTVHAKVNGGGPEIRFKTMNGSIYIRKGK